jgi:hypothetical protein
LPQFTDLHQNVGYYCPLSGATAPYGACSSAVNEAAVNCLTTEYYQAPGKHELLLIASCISVLFCYCVFSAGVNICGFNNQQRCCAERSFRCCCGHQRDCLHCRHRSQPHSESNQMYAVCWLRICLLHLAVCFNILDPYLKSLQMTLCLTSLEAVPTPLDFWTAPVLRPDFLLLLVSVSTPHHRRRFTWLTRTIIVFGRLLKQV